MPAPEQCAAFDQPLTQQHYLGASLLRNVLLGVMAKALTSQSLSQLQEQLHSHPARGLVILSQSRTQTKKPWRATRAAA